MIEEVGTTYFVLVVTLFICVGFDIVNYFLAFGIKKVNYTEYCTFGIKIVKLIMYLIFGIIMFALGFISELTDFSRNVHIIIGSLLVADFITGLILKIKFGKRKY